MSIGRLALAGPLALALAFGPVAGWAEGDSPHAVDWRIGLNLSETVEAETNARLRDSSSGAIFGATTRLGMDIAARTKRAALNLRAAVVGAVFGGGDDADGRTRIDPDLSMGYEYKGKDYKLSGAASFDVQPVSVAQFEDTGDTSRDALQLTGAYSASLAYVADKRNTVSVGTTGRVVDFARDQAGDALFGSRYFGLNGGLSHAATQTTSVSVSGGASYFESDNDINSKSHTFSLTAGVSHQRTSRHTVAASAGLTSVFSDNDLSGSSVNVGFNGGASLAYTGGRWNGSVGLSQAVSDSASGELRQFSSLRGALSYKVNSRNALQFGASATHSSDVGFGGDTVNAVSLGPSMSYRLTRDTSLNVGYGFRIRDDDDVQSSHRVYLTLSTNFAPLE